MRKLFAAIMLALLIMSAPIIATAASPQTKLVFNGQDITAEIPYRVINGRVYLPLRALTEEMGAYVSYADKIIQLTYNDTIITLPLDAKVATIIYPGKQPENIALDAPAHLWDSKTYVPLRFMAEAIPGWQISYNAPQKTVFINYIIDSPVLIDGNNLFYMTTEDGFGMSRSRYLYSNIAPIYEALSSGRIREVAEPKTDYGPTFTVYDYYALTDILYFYQEMPTQNDIPADKALLSYQLFHMYEGEPEFGADSRNLLYDVNADKWYVFDETAYRTTLNQMHKHLIYSSAA